MNLLHRNTLIMKSFAEYYYLPDTRPIYQLLNLKNQQSGDDILILNGFEMFWREKVTGKSYR
jgi:hypothetical protein